MSAISFGIQINGTNLSMWTALSELLMERMDDLIYVELLVISFFFSLLMRLFKCGLMRECSSAIIGISLIFYIARWRVFYSLIIVFGNIFLHSVVKNRYLPLISFVTTFIYLGLLRMIHLFGFPPLVAHVNAVQLIITLRLVGLSFEIEDARRKDTICYDTNHVRFIVQPCWWQTFFYSYSFAGLFTGPYYTYAMHRDVVDNDNIMDVSVFEHIKWRLLILIWSLPAFLILVYVFPLQMLREKQFYDETIFYRIYISLLIFFWMRCRVYSAWMVAESICILNGIGLYPEVSASRAGHGPTKLNEFRKHMNHKIKYDTEAVRNLDIWEIELDPTFRGGIRAWNRSVQYWLATFVYKRVPRGFGMLLTMSVSAFWHGVHPGYYLSFLTIPLCTFAEDLLFSIVPVNSNGCRPFFFNICWYIIRQLSFAFMASGFLLLTWTDTIRYWNSVHFYVHWFMVTIIVFAWSYKTLIYTSRSHTDISVHKNIYKSHPNEVEKLSAKATYDETKKKLKSA